MCTKFGLARSNARISTFLIWEMVIYFDTEDGYLYALNPDRLVCRMEIYKFRLSDMGDGYLCALNPSQTIMGEFQLL